MVEHRVEHLDYEELEIQTLNTLVTQLRDDGFMDCEIASLDEHHGRVIKNIAVIEGDISILSKPGGWKVLWIKTYPDIGMNVLLIIARRGPKVESYTLTIKTRE